MKVTEFDRIVDRHRALVNGASPTPSRADHDRLVLEALDFLAELAFGDAGDVAELPQIAYARGYEAGYEDGCESGEGAGYEAGYEDGFNSALDADDEEDDDGDE